VSSAGQAPQRPGIVARVAQVTAKHRRAAVIGWLVLLIGALAASGAIGTEFSNNFSLPGTESQRAVDLLKRDFPAQAGDSDQIVIGARQGSVDEAAVRVPVAAMLAKVATLPHVSSVVSPFTAKGANGVSPSGRIAFATVTFNERANLLPTASVERVIATAKRIASPELTVALGGQAIESVQKPSLGAATGIGLLAAIVVLLITFGSFLAMGLPILTALLGLGTGIGLAGLGSHLIGMPNFSTELAAMIGLGVGIDYALFIVTRFRENFGAEGDVQGAILGAMDTAGRAVLFAGATVIIALLGQFALGVEFLYGLAVASVLAVLMTMLAALSVLPALLSRFGERIGRPRRRRGRFRGSRDQRASAAVGAPSNGLWARWAGVIERHPWPPAIAGVAIMLALASPVLALRLGNSDAGNNPPNQTTRQAFDLLAKGFGPGFNGPLQVVASLPHADDSAAQTQRLTRGARRHIERAAQLRRRGLCVCAARESRWLDGGVQRLPAFGATGFGHQRTGAPAAPPHAPAAGASHADDTAGGRDDRADHRLHAGALKQAAAVHRGGRPALGAVAAACVSLACHPAAGSGHEPAVDRRVAGRGRGDLPVGLAGHDLRRQGRTDPSVYPGDAVRDRVRPVDGLRGLSDLTGA
jgi:RND superfamily putative drug exporter